MFQEGSTNSDNRTANSLSTSRQEKENEFARLRSVLPSISGENSVHRIDVLEEAIKYIAHLQAALENQTTAMTTEEVQRRFRESSFTRSLIRIRQRKIASFHAKLKTAPKPRRIGAPTKITKPKR